MRSALIRRCRAVCRKPRARKPRYTFVMNSAAKYSCAFQTISSPRRSPSYSGDADGSLSARKRQFVRMHARMKWSKTPRQVISFFSARRNRMTPSIPFERMKARATTSHSFVHGVATPIYKNTVYEFLEVLVLCIGCQFMY